MTTEEMRFHKVTVFFFFGGTKSNELSNEIAQVQQDQPIVILLLMCKR